MVTLIAAVSKNGIIGKNDRLPWRLSFDMKWFKMHTFDSAIIMGRKTFESIKNPLAGRLNIVLSRRNEIRLEPSPNNVIWCSSLDEAIDAAGNLKIFIIGGGEIYREALIFNMVTRMIITHVNINVGGVNTTEIILPQYFKSIYKSKVFTENAIEFQFEISVK
jgi:dihydrofolate reductase|tara:strand:- start:40 stop:528 length:489 start_codon:yes stop_codon:yes gene_type:complete